VTSGVTGGTSAASPRLDAEPFRIGVPEEVLTDLHERLARVRWPIQAQGPAWRYGTDLAWMKQVVEHWRTRYDWRRWEAEFNRWPQYRAKLGGKRVHFVLEKGSGPAPLPLILTHGWPGSMVEFLHLIEPLAHPERFGGDARDAFTVVVASLPGYGFSEAPDAPISPLDVARLWRSLMTDTLGFERYYAQGGDWGGIITAQLARHFPDNLGAIHLNTLALSPSVGASGQPLSDEEKTWLERSEKRRAGETAYQQIQGTKPQSLAYGLTDSPTGLAAWILEKFQGWTVPGTQEAPPFELDRLLTNVMLYWINGINAANWMYVSLVDGEGRKLKPGEQVQVPTGLMLMPSDLTLPAPESWARRIFARLEQVHYAPRGGHFPALECGDLFLEDVRGYFRKFR